MDGQARVERSFAPDPRAPREVRAFVRERAEASDLPRAGVEDLVLAVSEAVTNAVRHTASPVIRVACEPRPNAVEVRIRDEGVFRLRGLASRTDPSPGDLSGGGLGIPLMAALVDELRIDGGTDRRPGTLVSLLKRS